MSKIGYSSKRTTPLAARDVFRRRARPAQDALAVSKRVFHKSAN